MAGRKRYPMYGLHMVSRSVSPEVRFDSHWSVDHLGHCGCTVAAAGEEEDIGLFASSLPGTWVFASIAVVQDNVARVFAGVSVG